MVAQDSAYSYSIVASDVDTGDTLTLTAPTKPNWLNLVDNGGGTGTLSGTPTNSDVGVHNVTLRVSDGTVQVGQTFTVTVNNTDEVPVSPSTEPLPTGNYLSGTLNMGGQTITEETVVVTNASISYLIIESDVQNKGLIANSIIAASGTLTGGKLTGTIINEGTITDINFVGIKLSGGTLAGTITNNSQVGGIIENVTLAPNTTLTGGKLGGTIHSDPSSTVTDVQLAAGTAIIGGTLAGEIRGNPDQPAKIGAAKIAPGTKLSDVCLTPTVQLPDDVVLGAGVILPETLDNPTLTDFCVDPDEIVFWDDLRIEQLEPAVFSVVDAEQVSQIPPEAFAAIGPEQLAQLTKEALGCMTTKQLAYLPIESLRGLTAENMGGLSIAVIGELTPTHLEVLDAEQFQQMPSEDVSKLFTNLELDKVNPEDVENLVPDGWTLDIDTGALTAPTGAKLTLRTLSTPESSQIILPEALDMDTGFGIGGSGTAVMEGMTATLDLVQLDNLTLSQDQETGILMVTDNNQPDTKPDYSFMLNADEVIQADKGVSDDKLISTNEGGFITLTTSTGQQLTLVPAPRPVELSEVLEEGEVSLGKSGDVLMVPKDQAQDATTVAIFEPAIITAPKGMEPDLHLPNETESEKLGMVVYEDGTAQTIKPTLFSPEAFKKAVEDKYVFNTDGTFTVSTNGTFDGLYVVEPHFDVEIIRLLKGESVEPHIELNGEVLTYTFVIDNQEHPSTRKRLTRGNNGADSGKQAATTKTQSRKILKGCGRKRPNCYKRDCPRKCKVLPKADCDNYCSSESLCKNLCRDSEPAFNNCKNKYCG